MKRPTGTVLVRFHFTMMCLWALLAIPTFLWWKDSVLWVAVMSLYANFVGHFSAMGAARSERKQEEE